MIRENVADAFETNIIRENRQRILISVNIDRNRVGVYEFETYLPFFYRCPNVLIGECSTWTYRIKPMTIGDKGLPTDYAILAKYSIVVMEETSNNVSFFWTATKPPLVKRFDFKITGGCKCVCVTDLMCSPRDRVTYMRFVGCTVSGSHAASNI